jgi:hypothetical protein
MSVSYYANWPVIILNTKHNRSQYLGQFPDDIYML